MSDSTRSRFIDGWLGIDELQRSFAEWRPTLSKAASSLIRDAREDSPILLYQAFRDVLGEYPAYPAQGIGDCVGFSHGHGLDMLQCIEISLGTPASFRESSTEFIYAASREVAGLLDDRDGSYGSAAVASMSMIGVASREVLGRNGAYSAERAATWGRDGIPAEIKARASGMRLGAAARVSCWVELVAAMRNGYPVTVCSNRGFSSQRDAEGFCPAEGYSGHSMLIGGVRFDRPGACLLQSWGPDDPIGPLAMNQPGYSFWADLDIIEDMLAQGDSWAMSRTPRFAARALPEHWSYHQAA